VTLLYNFVMLAVDVALLWLVGRRKNLLDWFSATVCAGTVAVALGAILAGCFENHFGVFRLWAYGVFLHGVVLLAGTAILWRRQRPLLAGGAVVGALAVVLVAVDAFLIEPHWLEVSCYRIASPKIHRAVRIVVVADLQTDRVGPYERAVLSRVLEEKPDIILLAGDYLQASGEKEKDLKRELHDLLGELHFTAPGGVFAVQGNVDWPGWQEVFAGLGVTTVDAQQSFDLDDLQLTCLGLGESYSITPNITNTRPDRFHLVLGHVPNFALGPTGADLLVAGHTHGGQVRIPGIGPVITHSRVPWAWAAGLTELPAGGRLLVSRGIGMERGYAPPMRFLCRPELVVIELTPGEKETTHEHR
jgi:hypothetical protein